MSKKFWTGKKKLFFIPLIISDVFSFAVSVLLLSFLMNIQLYDPFYIRFYIFALTILIAAYASYGLYNNKRNLFDDTDFMNIVYSSIITFIILLIFTLIFNPQGLNMIAKLAIMLVISVILSTVGRLFLNKIVYFARKKGFDIKKTIFFGEEKDELLEKLEDKHLGYKVIKVTTDRDVLKKHLKDAEIVFIKMESIDDEMLELMTKNDNVNWKIISSILNLVIEPVAFDEFKDYPIINISNKDKTKGYSFIKRVTDIFMSGIAIVALFPFFLIIAAIMKITMPGPIFFRQKRVGKNLKPFFLYKLRTMRVGADKEKTKLKNEVKGLFKMKNDPRITPFGKILRRTCIDELPQLINIFIGDMSVVGPRPHLYEELHNFQGWRMARFNVKPGLTGLWQVNGRHELNFDKAILFDIYYVKHMSLLMDISIIFRTIPSIIMTKGRY